MSEKSLPISHARGNPKFGKFAGSNLSRILRENAPVQVLPREDNPFFASSFTISRIKELLRDSLGEEPMSALQHDTNSRFTRAIQVEEHNVYAVIPGLQSTTRRVHRDLVDGTVSITSDPALIAKHPDAPVYESLARAQAALKEIYPSPPGTTLYLNQNRLSGERLETLYTGRTIQKETPYGSKISQPEEHRVEEGYLVFNDPVALSTDAARRMIRSTARRSRWLVAGCENEIDEEGPFQLRWFHINSPRERRRRNLRRAWNSGRIDHHALRQFLSTYHFEIIRICVLRALHGNPFCEIDPSDLRDVRIKLRSPLPGPFRAKIEYYSYTYLKKILDECYEESDYDPVSILETKNKTESPSDLFPFSSTVDDLAAMFAIGRALGIPSRRWRRSRWPRPASFLGRVLPYLPAAYEHETRYNARAAVLLLIDEARQWGLNNVPHIKGATECPTIPIPNPK